MTEQAIAPELSDILISTVEEIFSTMICIEISFKEKREVRGFSVSGDYTGLMFIEGETPGMVASSISESFGRRIAGGMIGVNEDEVTAAQITDIMAEIVNMVCGGVKSRGASIKSIGLTPPLSISGDGHKAVWKTEHPVAVFTFEAGEDSFDILAYL